LVFEVPSRLPLFPEYGEEDRQDNADQYACSEGEIEAEPLPFDIDITGQLPEKRDLVAEHKGKSYYDKEDAENDEDLTHRRHYPPP
jgi:hypothetical protein